MVETDTLERTRPRVAQPKVLTTVNLRVDQSVKLRELCRRENESQAVILRRAVDRLLQEAGL